MEKEHRISSMPDQETLEEFLEGFSGLPTVIFNKITGEFEWLVERPDHTLGQAKTQYGEELKRL